MIAQPPRDARSRRADLKSAAQSSYHRGPGALRVGLLPAGAPVTAPPGEQVHRKDRR